MKRTGFGKLVLACLLTLAPSFSHAAGNAEQRILAVATAADVRKHQWEKLGPEDAPGNGPIGYTKGMALSYANAIRLLKGRTADLYISAMAKAANAAQPHDALYALRDLFAASGMHPERGGVDTLRCLYVLLYEAGLRESDGRYYLGIDTGPHKPSDEHQHPSADTTEAGLFQSSWNFADGKPLLQNLQQDYTKNKRACFADVFKEGLRPHAFNNIGTGQGAAFQQLAKACPGFAVEFAALSMRDNGTANYYFIRFRYLEISRDAERLFKDIEAIVDP